MPTQEFGIQVGSLRVKYVKIVETSQGIYIIFPIPELSVYLSLHYPNERYSHFGAFVRVPGLDLSYPLDLQHNFLEADYLLGLAADLNDIFYQGYNVDLDDTSVIVLPQSVLDPLMFSRKKNYIDLVKLLGTSWTITEADKMPELLDANTPVRVGLGMDDDNAVAYIVDRDDGVLRLYLDDILKLMPMDLIGDSIPDVIIKAFEEIQIRRPELIERWMTRNYGCELKRLLSSLEPKVIRV